MILIQPVLIGILILGVLVYLRFLRSRIFDRLTVILVGVTGVALVARPDWSDNVAHFFGVGRGADLISYFGIVGLAFVWLLTYSKIRRVEESLTALAREITLLRGRLENSHRSADSSRLP